MFLHVLFHYILGAILVITIIANDWELITESRFAGPSSCGITSVIISVSRVSVFAYSAITVLETEVSRRISCCSCTCSGWSRTSSSTDSVDDGEGRVTGAVTGEEEAALAMALAAWWRAARCRFRSFSAGPRWRGWRRGGEEGRETGKE